MVGAPTTPSLPGYRELAPLGRGGYSEVYRAYQDQFDRWVAVKVLTFALTDDRSQRRFLRECQVAGRLSAHPNIVTVYDAGLSPDGRPYISMELFGGGSIAERLRQGPVPVADALRLAVAVAGALESAHQAGVVHRDVKPGNILMATYGQPALTDFGLSILAERQEVSSGVDALTPYHAPPEVLERTNVTPAADVYSLASTTYAMLTGRAPHQQDGADDSMASLLLRILQVDVPPIDRPDVPAALDTALRGALARDPAARTPTPLAFAQALQHVQAEMGAEPTQPVVVGAPGGVGPSPAPAVAPDPAGAAGSSPTMVPELTPGFGSQAQLAGDATVGRQAFDDPAGSPVPPNPADPGVAPDPAIPPAPFAAGSPGSATPPPPAPGHPPPAPAVGGPPDPAAPPSPGHPPPAPAAAPEPVGDPFAAPPAPPAPPEPGAAAAAPTAWAPTGAPTAWAPPASSQPPAGWPGSQSGETPPGEQTVHRSQVRAARAEPLTAPEERRRRWVVPTVVGVVLLVVAGGVGAVLLTGDDETAAPPETTAPATTATTAPATTATTAPATTATTASGTTTTTAPPEVPTDVTADESPAGVQVSWQGPPNGSYAVLLLAEDAAPTSLRADGTSLLVPATTLRPGVGYCFSVALLATLDQMPPGETSEAFSPPACIRGASEATIRGG